jgi:hypothetical protein
MSMDELVFDQRRCVETLTRVIEQLLAEWKTLPASVRQSIETERSALRTSLPNASAFERTGKIINTLKALEALPEVAARCRAHFVAGKGPSYRILVQLNDEQIRALLILLATPAPSQGNSGESAVTVLEFALELTVLDRTAGGLLPVRVALTPDKRPVDQRADTLRIPFADLRQPLALEVRLSAPGFQEHTGDWTRTILVYPLAPSVPALFLLQGDQPAGRRWLRVDFAQLAGSVEREIELLPSLQAKTIAPPNRTGPTRGLGGEPIDYYTALDFPGQVLPQTIHPLIVRLTLSPPKAAPGQSAPAKATLTLTEQVEWLEVRITPSGFDELSANSRRLFRLHRHADSQPAVFLLQAGAALGDQQVALDFYHRGRHVLSTALFPAIVAQLAATPTDLRTRADTHPLEDLPSHPPPPPDLELRILFDPQARRLRFKLHAQNAELGYHDQDMGEVELTAEPRQVLEQTFLYLSELAAQTVDTLTESDSAAQLDDLIAIGQGLFERLFPPQFQQEYWRLKALREQGKVQTLLITSDEPWIPWELVKPFAYDQRTDQKQEDEFLALAFDLARWLPERGLAPAVDVKEARLVAPALNLAYTERERAFFASLHGRGLVVGAPLGKRKEVLDVMRDGKIKLLHMAAHGNFQPNNADESLLELENNERLRPSDLVGQRVIGLRRERPLVFLNACHSAQLDFALTGLGGWARTLVKDIGVSAFVGTLWEVNDLLAAEFAIQFYTKLIEGMPLAQAFRAARQHIHDQQPANPTWLAYTLYADPNARVTWSGLRG